MTKTAKVGDYVAVKRCALATLPHAASYRGTVESGIKTMKKNYIITYDFVSPSVNGHDYERWIAVQSKKEPTDIQAKLLGFKLYGARFTDNCHSWHIREAQACDLPAIKNFYQL